MRFRAARWLFCWIVMGVVGLDHRLWGDEPKPIPENRRTMLEALEKLKSRTPRLAMPEDAVRKIQSESSDPIVNNAMLRRLYLPAGFQSGMNRQPDPSMTLDSNLGVELFWIVSRVNNCHYCLGHQEAKLAKAGVSESTLAKLDTDWKEFSAEERYAFEFTKKLTDSPQSVSIADIQRLKEFFGESKALEIIFLVSRYNSTNRWTDSTGIPQEDYRSFQTTLEQSELQKPSIVAVNSSERRPELLSKEAWHVEIAKKAKRTSLFPLVDVEKVSEWTGLEGSQVPNHYRLLATFPIAGKPFVNQWQAVAKESLLPQHVPSVIAWIASRQDGAVYAQKMSFDQLRASGWSEDSIFALDTGKDLPDVKLMSVVAFAKKLTIEPQKMTDDDLQSLLKDYSPQQTAEIIFHVGMSAFLNRLTESAQLPF